MAPWNLKSNLSIFRSIFPKITPSSYEYNKKKRKQKRDEKFRSSFNSKTITSRSEKKKSSNQRAKAHYPSYCLRVIRVRLSRLP